MKLSQLPVGALVKDPNTKYNNDVIIWQVLEHGHTGDPSGSTTLQSRDILTLKPFDAHEPSNSNNNRKNYGNNRYKYSNILQWLNSDKNSWYEAQHTVDMPPSSSYVYQESGTAINPYDSEAGFLTNLSDKFKKALMTVSKVTALTSIDGGGSEIVDSKIFLLSKTEIDGTSHDNTGVYEGSKYSLYNTASYRLKNLFNDAAKGNYSSATSPGVWFTRSTNNISQYWDNCSVYRVKGDGNLDDGNVDRGYHGIAPALCISSDTEVSDTPDASNVYTLQFDPSCVKAYIGDANGLAKLIWEQEHEIEALVPVMTSNTTPSGEVITNKSIFENGYAYYAFDNVSNYCKLTYNASLTDGYVGYVFTSPVVVKSAVITCNLPSSDNSCITKARLIYSDDGSTWNNASDIIDTTGGGALNTMKSTETGPHLYWAVGNLKNNGNNTNLFISTIQFYGYKA